MTTYQPYTYHIAWTGLNLHYYGVRYASDCHPNDFWNTYYTSSKVVCQYRETHGEPDVIEIRRTFKDSDTARAWESKVLRRLNVKLNESWMNHHANEAPRWNETHREAHLNGVRGRKYSEAGKTKLAESRKKSWQDPEYRANMMESYKDKMTDDSKAKIAEFQTGRERSQKCKDNSRAMRLAEWADEDKAAARKKAISDKIKAKWADPEYRAKQMAQRKKKS